jgi:phage baseplate assembly protein gpV
MLSKANTCLPVKVVAVINSGGVEPVGFVDVLPLVNQIDGKGESTPHTTIYNIPYFRLQGGADAIIIDPVVGDVGAAIFCQRDISCVKKTKKQSNPGSYRKYDLSDGLYFGGFLNGTPSQYIRFSGAGIEVHSPAKVLITAPTAQIFATESVTLTGANVVNVTSENRVNVVASARVTLQAPEIALCGAIIGDGVEGSPINITNRTGTINLNAPGTGNAISVTSENIGLNGAVSSGAVTADGEVTGNGVGLSTHTHKVVVGLIEYETTAPII